MLSQNLRVSFIQAQMGRSLFACLATVSLFLGNHAAMADLALTGDTTPAPGTSIGDFNSTDDVTIGNTGSGTMTVDGATSLTNKNARVGFAANSVGEVDVSGAGTLWVINNNLDVGIFGSGSLKVSDGAQVDSRYVGVGHGFATSQGSAEVTGENSLWRVQDIFSDLGKITISNGGTLEAFLPTGDGLSTFNVEGGTIAVKGVGSTLKLLGDLHSLRLAAGSALEVTAGGRVENGLVYLNKESIGDTRVLVSGQGSILDGRALITNHGDCLIEVLDGGTIDMETGLGIGFTSPQSARTSLNVSGAGSTCLWSGIHFQRRHIPQHLFEV